MLGIVRPDGGYVENAASIEFACQKLDKGRLYDAPLVMPFFVPGIREKQVYPLQRIIG